MDSLFGSGGGIGEPWYGYWQCELKELSQCTVDFIGATVGLDGEWHGGMQCWVVNMQTWSAVQRFAQWCLDEKLDILHHMEEVKSGSQYYVQLATTKLREFGAFD